MSLTTEQASEILDVPAPTLRQWVHRGKLQPIRRGTRPLEFDETVVAALRDSRWRDEQRRIGSQLGDAIREYDRVVAEQAERLSRCR